MASSVLVTPILLLRLALGILPPACQPPNGFSRPVTRFDRLYARGPNKDLAAAEQACNNDFPGSEMVLFDDVKEIELIWSRKYRTYTVHEEQIYPVWDLFLENTETFIFLHAI